jgi:UDP-N-acetyl-D-galactosamine dehydrogenase
MRLVDAKIAVIGLGYVGLPLAFEFAKHYQTLGFDSNIGRVNELKSANDVTGEIHKEFFSGLSNLTFSANITDLPLYNVYVVAVPTPAVQRRPDLDPLLKVSAMLGQALKKGDIVIFESTVYPGVTEDECVPVIEESSGLRYNIDFFVGYSPERINPGDKCRKLSTIKKLVAGSNLEASDFVEKLYASIITAGVHRTSCIRVAEAAKVIENVQRDINIALINEFSMIFSLLDIDTEEVLEAAETKWNFLPFRPGLVGGHCIGVDSYYLAYKAKEVGHYPRLIVSGRSVNEGMAMHAADKLIKLMLKQKIHINGSSILVLGLSFKENCPDLRNTKVVDMVQHLNSYGVIVDVFDPRVNKDISYDMYGIKPITYPRFGHYDAIIIAVAHDEFRLLGVPLIRSWGKAESLIYDLKHVLHKTESDLRL